eukprot:CAMPEP_0194445240 /NCGR_PEP_ID=MMETSP0176-20130528/127743_1 /TAXON_ID=216777 /ORGANISM="Proboscia alata, Strain PI-D3" /LENGTH=986 /DNA_ID=CAMNT_0039271763 /DNA_START=29 /DNA_END=2989 /DNA_ORIENTATION=+
MQSVSGGSNPSPPTPATARQRDSKADAQAFNTYASLSAIFGEGYVRNGLLTIPRSVKDVDGNSKRTFLHQIPLSDATNLQIPPVEVHPQIQCRLPSPSGDKVAVFRTEDNSSDKNAKPRQVVEIWTHGGSMLAHRHVIPAKKHGAICWQVVEIWTHGGSMLASRHVIPAKKHGPICFDGSWFGGMSWNPDETAIVYVAEEPPPKTSSFFATDDGDGGEENENGVGGEYTLGRGRKETWGEKYTTTSRLTLYLLSVSNGRISSIDNVPRGTSIDESNDNDSSLGGYTLGQPIFSPCGTCVVYTGWDAGGGGRNVAEEPPPKTSSFFATDDGGDGEKNEDGVGGEYTLGRGRKETWGEKYSTTSRLTLYLLSVSNGRISSIDNVPRGIDDTNDDSLGGYTLGQPIFSPCGTCVVYTGWDAGGGGRMPKRLGSIYCYQRSCRLYRSLVSHLLASLDAEDDVADSAASDDPCLCLTPQRALSRSPRFVVCTPDDEDDTEVRLVYLTNEEGFDTHDGCMALETMDWNLQGDYDFASAATIVECVPTPKLFTNDTQNFPGGLVMDFPGLFLNQLPQECVTPDGNYIFVTSIWGSMTRVLRISLADGSIYPLNFELQQNLDDAEASASADPHQRSQRVICVAGDDVIVAENAPNQPAVLGALSIKYIDDDFSLHGITFGGIGFRDFDYPPIPSRTILNPLPMAVSAFSSLPATAALPFTYEILTHPNPDSNLPPVQSILLLPTNNNNNNDTPPPLIVVPHGGPHSCATTSYFHSYAYLASSGYAILQVNYRGSTGFGHDFLTSLAGNIGVTDVADVVAATNNVLSRTKALVDGTRVGICGGSHGGFLACHLIGQHPELFKVAAMRNPVTNIATMVTATDIPDWCYVETFGPGSYDYTKFQPPTADQLQAMHAASPVAHLHKVTAPTLIALGLSDKRVPPSQGLEYYHALRAKNGRHPSKTKLLVYEENDHAIDQPACDADHWVNAKQFFDEHL